MLTYSARKNSANFSDEYSVWKPPTSSPSASAQVERRPVGLADHRDHVDRRTRRAAETMNHQVLSARRRSPRSTSSRRRGTPRRTTGPSRSRSEIICADERSAAEQRVRRAGRPAGEHDAVDADRGDGEDEEHRDREVGELQRGLVAEDRDRRAERDDREREEAQRRGDDRRQDEDRLVGGLRDDVFLQRQLDAVGEASAAGRTGRCGSGRGAAACGRRRGARTRSRTAW